jgi:hypothetical protein
VLTVALAGCAGSPPGDEQANQHALAKGPTQTLRPQPSPQQKSADGQAPKRFTIIPDHYHVPYAGTAGDGRRFFLSNELFSPGGSAYVGLFLWHRDGTFARVEVTRVHRPRGLPIGQAAPAGRRSLIKARLAELGDYVLGPITVEPFTERVDGVTFGWKVGRYKSTYFINVEPGDFIAYYAPWDGRDYDT